jgi:hypothetical protein
MSCFICRKVFHCMWRKREKLQSIRVYSILEMENRERIQDWNRPDNREKLKKIVMAAKTTFFEDVFVAIIYHKALRVISVTTHRWNLESKKKTFFKLFQSTFQLFSDNLFCDQLFDRHGLEFENRFRLLTPN